MTNPIGDPLVGRTIAHYEVVARVGGGAMGVVYQARDTKLGRRVALKFLPQQWSHDETAKQRFVREAQAASATSHPNICTIHDIETADDGQLFIVMAYYDGPTLKQRLESGPVVVEEALEIATQIADGLAKAHAQGVVHRDIKPGNVMLTEDGVRILDFGLATFVDALKLTTENSTLGTPAYMSPEQVQGRDADARSDVWAVGVVLYEMLVGHVPFRGTHSEAIAYAIRHEAPVPLRASRPEVPEEIEQLVFRAMHKDPGVRYPSGRELARALRQVRGLSTPITEPIAVPRPAALPGDDKRQRRKRRMAVAATLLVGAVAGSIWIAWPAERALVAVVPFVNETGYAELDVYRLPLTEELTSQLADLASIRVLPHDRLLQIIRPFRQDGRDVSSREAVQAVATQSGARALIVPIVSYKDGAWIVRVEFRNAETGTNQGVFQTAAERSSLMKETVYRHAVGLSIGIDEHFTSQGTLRASLKARLRYFTGRVSPPSIARFRTLDAAASFEGGIDAYERLELAAARSAFGNAAEQDPRNPLPRAWQSRMAALMRQDREAVESAELAQQFLTNAVQERDRLFVQAVAAEARSDSTTAGASYRQLVARYSDEPGWLIELAAFQDRQGDAPEAVETYHRAIARDSRLVRPHLELCRLYSPSRLNEPALAKEQGQLTLKLARDLRNEGAEAQALWCLTDVLRSGTDAERQEARRDAEAALAIMERLQYPFGIARGYNYVAIVALLADKDAARARPLLDKTLTAARNVGFVLLEARALMNLGSALEMLGQRSAALEQFRSSFTLSEALSNQQDAAWNQINIAAILVDYGDDPDAGLREAQNALGVFHDIADADFEAFSRQIIGSYYRHIGQYDEAIRHLTLGVNLASGRDLDDKVTQLTIEIARVRFDQGDYVQAHRLLQQAAQHASGLNAVHARLGLGRTHARLGEFAQAQVEIDRAAADIERSNDTGSLPLLRAALGELAYEMGRDTSAQSYFRQASVAWSQDLPEDASVEARAYLGWLEASQGDRARGVSALVESLQRARRTRRVTIEARCLLFLARLAIKVGNVEEAIRRLEEMPVERQGALSPELQAQIRHSYGQALARRGDQVAAAREAAAARALIEQWHGTLSPRPGRRVFY